MNWHQECQQNTFILGNRPGELANGFHSYLLLAHLLGVICEVKRHMCTKSPQHRLAILLRWLSICFPAGGRTSFAKCCVKTSKAICSSPTATRRLEVPGFRFDGPQLAKTTGGNGWIKMLRQRELKLYQWMASYLPVLLIRLGIDEQTAFARKPDHQLAALQEKIAVTPQLTFNGAKILELDGRQPADEILQASLRAIHAALS